MIILVTYKTKLPLLDDEKDLEIELGRPYADTFDRWYSYRFWLRETDKSVEQCYETVTRWGRYLPGEVRTQPEEG